MMQSVNELMTDTTIRNLWLWHSVEEPNTKLLHSTYQHLYGNGLSAYIPRISVFTFSLILITAFSTIYQIV